MTQRTLGEWLAYLEQLHPSAIDMGLERSQQVAARLGLGRPAPRVITVTEARVSSTGRSMRVAVTCTASSVRGVSAARAGTDRHDAIAVARTV